MDITNLIPVNMAGEYDNFDPYSSHVIPALIHKFENARSVNDSPIVADPPKPEIVLWGDGSVSREFLYAGDFARAIEVSLKKKTGPDPINIGTGREITIRDLANLVRRIGQYDVNIFWDTSQPNGQPRRSLSTRKAKEILRWEATTSLEKLIERTIRWYRQDQGLTKEL
jgi:GDP-L-fucose synthase